MRRRLRDRLTIAVRDRDRPAVAALRSVLAALDNAEAVPAGSGSTAASEHVAGAAAGVGAGDVARRVLGPDEERDVVGREVDEMRSGAQEYEALGATDRADELRRAATLIGEIAGA